MSTAKPAGLSAELADGRNAIPRRNGELVFNEPWEARAFGIAVALCERGLFAWEDFSRRLIARIAAWQSEHLAAAIRDTSDPSYPYYALWLAALEDVLAKKGVLTASDLELRLKGSGS